jgi:Lon protease-like protein
MFPLGRPLLPYTGIPLHVFEDRYRRLMSDILDGDRSFGIVMIERGSEVGGDDSRASVGTLARVADAEQLEDGRWIMIATGITRLRVLEWLPDDPYPRAVIEEIPHRTLDDADDLRNEIEAAVRRIAGLLTELQQPAPPIDVALASEALAASYQALALTPVGPLDLQGILEIGEDEARIEAARAALRDTEELLRLQISTT